MGVWSIVWGMAWVMGQACSHGDGDVDEASVHSLNSGQSTACVAEDLEGDGVAEQPRALLVGSTLVGRVCEDVDVFLVNTADSAGALANVEIEPRQGVGQLAVSVTGSSDGSLFLSQGPVGVEQSISFPATGDTYMLTVRMVASLPAELATGRAYAATLRYLRRSMGDCCSSGEGPGCADDSVLTCLCQLDNACCRDSFDSTCVAEARSSCELTCGGSPPANDCCTVSSTGGCAAPEVNDCVCGIDPYCCVGGFDENCVNLASNRCAAACSPSAAGAP